MIDKIFFYFLSSVYPQRGKPVSRSEVAHEEREQQPIQIEKSNVRFGFLNIGQILDIDLAKVN